MIFSIAFGHRRQQMKIIKPFLVTHRENCLICWKPTVNLEFLNLALKLFVFAKKRLGAV